MTVPELPLYPRLGGKDDVPQLLSMHRVWHEWTDCVCTCDDDCPECGARHMSPYRARIR